jgi:hypothetical protein
MLSLLTLIVAGCAAPFTYNHPTKPLAEKQRDHLECLALANQAAMGAGGWSSDPAIRQGFFAHARDQYFLTCLQSRGWVAQPRTPVHNTYLARRPDGTLFESHAELMEYLKEHPEDKARIEAQTRMTPGSAPAPTPAPTPVKMDDDAFRQCTQLALSKLGLYHGPFKTDWTPEWQAVWQRYLDWHAELRNDQRQAAIRAVLDRELAAIQDPLDWQTCTS